MNQESQTKQTKEVLVSWDENIFDGVKRKLSNAQTLYTQLYLGGDKGSWSLVFNFDVPPIEQGFLSIGNVCFLVEDAPQEILKKGFQFSFMDGPKIIGTCEII